MKIGIITGASSGLGVEYAKRAAEACGGLDELWLIARRRERLEAITADCGCPVRVLPLDLANPGSFDTLSALLAAEQPEIRLLINNAGLGYLGDFDAQSIGQNTAMCDVNVRALTVVSGLAVPYMTAGSAILLVSSIASFVPTPRMSVYCSTKAYVSSLAKALREELRPRGVNVLAVNPCPMETEFLAVGNITGKSAAFDRLPRCQPDRVAAVSLRRALRGKGQHTPLPLFKLYRVLAKFLPHNLLMKVSKV
ncbi:MAG: SDR family NAD(P)-dependent oxidoreductase [Ruminococcaceae bacterium]|nr:SDR family NAD(P)-dependent oxidoreductase [Oscillospiraceae bacterium]